MEGTEAMVVVGMVLVLGMSSVVAVVLVVVVLELVGATTVVSVEAVMVVLVEVMVVVFTAATMDMEKIMESRVKDLFVKFNCHLPQRFFDK